MSVAFYDYFRNNDTKKRKKRKKERKEKKEKKRKEKIGKEKTALTDNLVDVVNETQVLKAVSKESRECQRNFFQQGESRLTFCHILVSILSFPFIHKGENVFNGAF
jgi:hypothetical protein